MFSFLNRTKNSAPTPSSSSTDTTHPNSNISLNSSNASATANTSVANGTVKTGTAAYAASSDLNGTSPSMSTTTTTTMTTPSQLEANLNEVRKNFLEAILLRRTDIVVSLINEWFKEHKNADEGLKYFFNANYCEKNTSSPLLVAYALRDKDLIRTLLNFGADPSLRDTKTNKCLLDLITDAASNNATESTDMTQLVSDCFMQSIVQSNLTALRQYLRAGFDLNPPPGRCWLPDGNSYLHWAAMYANESVVRLLIENGANVNCVNKHGASPLHEAVLRKALPKEEQMRIIETLLVHKADAVHVRGTKHDLNALDLAAAHADADVYGLIRDFVADLASMASASSSLPTSPAAKSPPYHQQQQQQPPNSPAVPKTPSSPSPSQQPLPPPPPSNHSPTPSISSQSSSIKSETLSQQQQQGEHMNSWVQSQPIATPLTGGSGNSSIDEKVVPPPSSTATSRSSGNSEEDDLKSLLWPRPKLVTLLGGAAARDERFFLPNVKHQPLYIYFRPPHTYAYMDAVNKLATAFSACQFYCIHRPPASEDEQPYICVCVDENQFSRHDEYSILVTKRKILINAANSVALQYAFFTFMQLIKIYARHSIPSLRIIDYSDVKYRSVLFDFSQGFYFKYENLLAVLQMLAFYKINQVHFYVKFSSLPPASLKKQWYHYISNWFGLMKFCEDVHLQIVPSIDIANDVAELSDVMTSIKEYLELFKGSVCCSRFVNMGPRLSSLLTCMENKNPFGMDSSTSMMMLCSYLMHSGDAETAAELAKFDDRYVLMEYGLKSGADFGAPSKVNTLIRSGHMYFYCIGNSNWNSMLGCPDGFLHNLYDAVERVHCDRPAGLLMCNFVGSLNKNAFAFNLNNMVMFAGAAWNSSITMNEIKKNIPSVLVSHGLINDKDGELGIVMFELGHLETFLTRKSVNAKNFLDLPYDQGSIFSRLLNNPDEVDLDTLDKHIFRKSLFHLRAQQSKLKSLLTGQVNVLFKEVSISAEIAFHLFKFLITLYNTGTRHQTANKAVGLNVINIGVSNLTQTVRTDLANKLLILKEEYRQILEQIYFKESVEEHVENTFARIIDQLLADQTEANMAELAASIKNRQRAQRELQQQQKIMRSVSTSSANTAQSAYFVDYSNDDDEAVATNHLLVKK